MATLLSHHPGPSFVAVRECANMLRESQFVVGKKTMRILWGRSMGGRSLRHGQCTKSGTGRLANLTDPERALWRSQRGPLASNVLMAFPTSRSRIDPQPFRVLLCRRLQLPLPFSSRTCQCGRLLDCRGHHRAACAEAGVLGARGFALERAAECHGQEPRH